MSTDSPNRGGPIPVAVLHDALDDDLDDRARAAGDRIAARLTGLWAESAARPVRLRTRIPAWTTTVRAAASARSAPIQKVTDRDGGLEYTRMPSGRFETRIAVRGLPGHPSAVDFVRVHPVGQDTAADLLIPLSGGAGEGVSGQVITTRIAMWDELDCAATEVSALAAADATAIAESVRAAPIAGRNAWRRIAKRLPEDHAVRRAVLEGLRGPLP
ncbi:hypothetical protein ACTD5D_27495 [Nocardia takedensis]|uniref:hypothetical protein n=1 Tax=Nocardia takedensis TaxID=259390 RepID=UPI0002F3D288|nr:hypothetical protein [Nocardia takedensis]